jgi:hypothetical protein
MRRSQGNGCLARVDDGLVEANRGAQFFLQAGVIEDVVVPKRLLDHQQVELIEAPQVFDLIERVGGVGVAAQRDIGPARADFLQHIDIPARLHFHLDAAVTGGQFDLDFID